MSSGNTAARQAVTLAAWAPQRTAVACLGRIRDRVNASRHVSSIKLILYSRLALASLMLASPVRALDPARSISQYGHTAWTLQEGFFPGAPTDMAQTRDGYLWIATRAGVVRFDGVRFVPLTPPPGEELPTTRVLSLQAGRDGSLWIGTRGGLVRWHEGHLTRYPDTPGSVVSILEDGGGTIWFTRASTPDDEGPICEVTGEHSRCHGVRDGVPVPVVEWLATDAHGNFWAVSQTRVVRWSGAGTQTWLAPGILDGKEGEGGATVDVFQSILPASDGSVWVGAMQPSRGLGLLRLVNDELRPYVSPDLDGRKLAVSRMLFDRDRALWIGTQDDGVYRLYNGNVSHYRSGNGLSSDTVQNLFEDREGTLWVLTTRGIDAFRDLPVTSVTSGEGLSGDLANAVLAARDGTVWIDAWHSLDAWRDGKITSLKAGKGLPGAEITALFEDRTGTLWLGVDGDLMAFEGGKFNPVRRADGASLGFIQQMTEDVSGDLWVVTSNNETLWRLRDRRVIESVPRSAVPFAYGSIVPDPYDGIWLPLKNGDLGRYRRGELETIHFNRAPGRGSILGLVAAPDDSIIGSTTLGLIGWRGGKPQTMTVAANGLPCNEIHTLLSDDAGALWLYASCGIIFVAADQVQAWWRNPEERLSYRVLDALDGVQPARGNLFPRASRGPDGRLWFANASIVQFVDPARLGGNMLPPPVHIEGIVADRATFAARVGLRLPPHTRDLEIDYTALSFVVPRKTQFRYRLEGHDISWQDAGARRQAFYTDLRPGDYHFQVIASNNNGVWNQSGARLDFSIAPAFYQTRWFAALCLVAVVGLLLFLYLARARQIEGRMQMRLEERLIERERIARELHDTLLQSFHGLLLQLQTAYKLLPAHPDKAKQTLESTIDGAAEAATEGRDTVQGLRASLAAGNDLAVAIKTLGEELAGRTTAQRSPELRVDVTGAPRALRPIVRDEIYRVAGEALRNGFRHAAANRIEVDLCYDERQLRLRVRDDGRGLDPCFLGGEIPNGHYGLRGMRERAKLMGGSLDVWTAPGSGTEVDLRIPASRAYAALPAVRRRGLFRMLFGARVPIES